MAVNLEKEDSIKYYFAKGSETFGPFNLADLLKKIDANTLIWYEGIDWTEAKNDQELSKFFRIIEVKDSSQKFDSKKTTSKKSIFIILILILVTVSIGGYLLFSDLNNSNATTLPSSTKTTSYYVCSSVAFSEKRTQALVSSVIQDTSNSLVTSICSRFKDAVKIKKPKSFSDFDNCNCLLKKNASDGIVEYKKRIDNYNMKGYRVTLINIK